MQKDMAFLMNRFAKKSVAMVLAGINFAILGEIFTFYIKKN
jgi:hypothetical protein